MKHLKFVPLALGLTTAAAVAGPSENVAPASSGWVGDFSIGITDTNLFGDPSDSEADSFYGYEFELQMGRDFGDYFVQFDFFGEQTDVGKGDSDSYDKGLGFAVHVVRDTNFGSIGGFAGITNTEQDNDDTNDSWRYFLGVESQLERNEADYYFQVGYIFGQDGEDEDGEGSYRDGLFGRAVATRELTETLSLTAEIGYAYGDMDTDGDDLEIYGFGLALNHQCTDNMLASLSYDFTHYRQEDGSPGWDEIDEHVVGLTLTWSFGSGSHATDLGLPRFLRWSGLTGGQIE